MKSFLSLLFAVFVINVTFGQIPLAKSYTYKTGVFDGGGTEIISWDRNSERIFSTNRSTNSVDIIQITDITKPQFIKTVDLSSYIFKVNSVSVNNGIFAAVGEGPSPQGTGKIAFYTKDGVFLKVLSLGFMPDMVTHTPGGNKVIVANEGEPSDDYTVDPPGSVSIIDISSGVNTLTQANVINVAFDRLDTIAIDSTINIHSNPGQTLVSEDLEPEYIAVNNLGTKAYVSLQENNAIMVIDITSATIDTVIGLGTVDRSTAGNGLDASDFNQNIDIATYNRLFAMYQPDAITTFQSGGNTYIASANEGDPRDYTGYSEIERVRNMILDPSKFSNIPSFIHNNSLGRLEVSTAIGDNNNDILFDSLFTFGTRSFSIWDENLQLVWDSGDDFEQIISAAHPSDFNSNNNDNSSFKDRSDNRGPEPEAIITGEVDGTLYAFIGLERMGGFMVYDISNPSNPQFEMYELNRDFSKPANDADAGDLGPESILFIPKNESPSGIALIVVANEISGTISIYQIGQGIGLEEQKDAQFLKAYPNPSEGKVNLSQYGNYKVYDSNGCLIQQIENENSVNLEGEAEGLYIIRDDKGNLTRIIRH